MNFHFAALDTVYPMLSVIICDSIKIWRGWVTVFLRVCIMILCLTEFLLHKGRAEIIKFSMFQNPFPPPHLPSNTPTPPSSPLQKSMMQIKQTCFLHEYVGYSSCICLRSFKCTSTIFHFLGCITYTMEVWWISLWELTGQSMVNFLSEQLLDWVGENK